MKSMAIVTQFVLVASRRSSSLATSSLRSSVLPGNSIKRSPVQFQLRHIHRSIQRFASAMVIEQKVCAVDDLQDGEMREVEVGPGKVLVTKYKGKFSAVGTKCTHYGAPLIKGSFKNGVLRCPWHGACFNSCTGDIEDFPGLDSLAVYKVDIKNGDVFVVASEEELKTSRRTKPMAPLSKDTKETYLMIGGGGTSLVCAETLRQEGFKGRIVIASKEEHMPYDRPKLSKALGIDASKLYLRSPEFLKDHDIEVLGGKEVDKLDPKGKTVQFQDGSKMNFDKVLLASGGKPRVLAVPGANLQNILYLRSPEDAKQIDSLARGKHVVVIGTGFIGLEVAAFMADKAASVSVVGSGTVKVPFERVFGHDIGLFMKKMHEGKGVKFYMDHGTKEIKGENGKVTAVVLQNGETIKADVVIPGIGMTPSTDYVKGTDIRQMKNGAIITNKYLEAVDGVFAGGDIAAFPYFLDDDQIVNIGHWQLSSSHGRCAALNMMGKKTEFRSVPFFWTMQFGKSIRYAGHAAGFDDILYEGSVEEGKFVAYFTKGQKLCATASLGMDPKVAEMANLLASGNAPSKDELRRLTSKV